MSVPRGWGWGRDLGNIPIEGIFVEMDRDGGGVLTHGKRQSMCVMSILKFASAFVQANQSFLSPFRVSSKK